MADMDPRFLLKRPLESWPKDVKNQLIDAVEYTKVWPRGSTGNAVVEGSSVVYFDIPQNLCMLSSPDTQFDITFSIEKQKAGKENWIPLEATDMDHFVLTENFVAHAFSSIEWQVNHMPTKVSGFIQHGQALYESFVASHLHEDAKLMIVSSEKDPAFQTFLRDTEWKVKSGTTTNKWTAYATPLFNDNDRTFTVSYRPMSFPFQLAPPTSQETYVIPSIGAQYTVALTIDLPLNNVYTIHPANYADAKFKLNISNIELNLAYCRLSALGEKAFTGSPKAPLAEYPGAFVKQIPMFLAEREKQAIFNFPEIPLPTYILLQAFTPDVLTSGKKPDTVFRTRALAHNVSEATLKFNDQNFYVSPIYPGKVGDDDMKRVARRHFYEKPFFQMRCHQDIAKGDIVNYGHPHLLFDLTNGGNQRIQTINSIPDPTKGKLSIHLKGNATSGLKELYLLSFIYNDCGVLINRQDKTFVSSYYAL